MGSWRWLISGALEGLVESGKGRLRVRQVSIRLCGGVEVKSSRAKGKLPKELESLFWEYDPEGLSLSEDREFIIKRVLSHGSIEDFRALRKTIGDKEIKAVLMRTRGRGIDRRRIRFYQVIFSLPAKEVEAWLSDPARTIWEGRCKE